MASRRPSSSSPLAVTPPEDLSTLKPPKLPADGDLSSLHYVMLPPTWDDDILYSQMSITERYVCDRLLRASIREVPAGSLANSDRDLQELSGLDPRQWAGIRSTVLRVFDLCSDGRLYADMVLGAVRLSLDTQKKKNSEKKTTYERERKQHNRHLDRVAKTHAVALGLTVTGKETRTKILEMLMQYGHEIPPELKVTYMEAKGIFEVDAVSGGQPQNDLFPDAAPSFKGTGMSSQMVARTGRAIGYGDSKEEQFENPANPEPYKNANGAKEDHLFDSDANKNPYEIQIGANQEHQFENGASQKQYENSEFANRDHQNGNSAIAKPYEIPNAASSDYIFVDRASPNSYKNQNPAEEEHLFQDAASTKDQHFGDSASSKPHENASDAKQDHQNGNAARVEPHQIADPARHLDGVTGEKPHHFEIPAKVNAVVIQIRHEAVANPAKLSIREQAEDQQIAESAKFLLFGSPSSAEMPISSVKSGTRDHGSNIKFLRSTPRTAPIRNESSPVSSKTPQIPYKFAASANSYTPLSHSTKEREEGGAECPPFTPLGSNTHTRTKTPASDADGKTEVADGRGTVEPTDATPGESGLLTPPAPARERRRPSGGSAFDPVLLVAKGPAWLPQRELAVYLELRQASRNRITCEAGLQAVIQRLDSLRQEGYDPAQCLTHSAAGGFRGIFPPPEATRALERRQPALTGLYGGVRGGATAASPCRPMPVRASPATRSQELQAAVAPSQATPDWALIPQDLQQSDPLRHGDLSRLIAAFRADGRVPSALILSRYPFVPSDVPMGSLEAPRAGARI